MQVSLESIIGILTVIIMIGSIVGVFIHSNNRITVLETKLEYKIDRELLLKKMDELRISIEKKISDEMSKLKCQNC
jgi:hypothetical protein